MITRKQIEDNYKKNNEEYVEFEMSIYWMYASIENMNDLLDDSQEVQDGHLLQDVSYEPLRLEGDEIVYKVTANDLSEYLNEENEEDYGYGHCGADEDDA